MKHVHEPLPPAPDGVVPAAVMRVIQKATAKDPGDRWPSAGAFVDGLEAANSLLAAAAAARDTSQATRRPPWLGVTWIAVVCSALVLATGLTWFAMRDPPPPPLQAPASPRPSDTVLPSIPTPVLQGPTTAAAIKKPSVRPSSVVQRASPPPPQNAPAPPVEPLPSPPDRAENSAPQTSTQVSATSAAPATSTTTESGPPVVAPPSPPAADVLIPATRSKTVKPVYPPVLLKVEIEGDVHLMALVGPNGRVTEVTVVRSSDTRFVAAAKAAVLRYEYTPATRNGVPESARKEETVSFRLR